MYLTIFWYLMSFFFLNFNFFFFIKTMNFLSIKFFLLNNIFIIVVLMIFLFVYYFSFYYVNSDNFIYFMFFLMIFASSMLLLLMSNSMMMMFLGWDGLGISSFVLVDFFKNWNTLNNSILTFMSNRMGDVLFLLFFCNLIFFWNKNLFFFKMNMLLLILTSMTKSAQFPIMSWLPAAMAAPTPVSALVHSSTLVTAGVFLLFTFNFFFSKKMMFFLFFIAVFTILISGISAILEKDFKKMVAFSTLSQMGFLFLMMSNFKMLMTLFHLFSHAFFKSVLFISVGSLLHSSNSNQESRSNLKNFKNNNFSYFIIMVSIMNLTGLLFTSGFFSKDLFIFFFYKKNMNMLIIFFFIVFLTFLYSSKMFFFILNMNFNLKKENSTLLNFSMLFLFMLSIFFSVFFNQNMLFFFEKIYFFLENFFIFFFFSLMFFFLNFFFMKKKWNYLFFIFGITYIYNIFFNSKIKIIIFMEKYFFENFIFYFLAKKNIKINMIFMLMISGLMLFI